MATASLNVENLTEDELLALVLKQSVEEHDERQRQAEEQDLALAIGLSEEYQRNYGISELNYSNTVADTSGSSTSLHEEEELMVALAISDNDDEEKYARPLPPNINQHLRPLNSSSQPVKQNPQQAVDTKVDITCDICWDAKKTIVLVPCGHMVSCDPCWENICQTTKDLLCPVCRSDIASCVRTFL